MERRDRTEEVVAMARPMWSGAVSFGLVTVPVKLYSATSSHTVRFNQFQVDTGERVRHKRVAEGTGEEVPYEDIVKGYEVDDGRYVMVTQEELESVEPGRSRAIEIEDFVALDEIDPIIWNKTYYLAPQEDVGAEKPYALLLEAMRSTNRVGIARFVMRGKQYLATIRPIGELLGLETMYFADEIRSTEDVDNAPVDAEPSKRELHTAEQLIESLSVEWDPTGYRDTYRERVMELIERKAEGEEIVVEDREETPEVADLMSALRASVKETTRRRQRGKKAARASGDGLDELSKDELYERASDAGITGRSKMSKEQLVDALRQKKKAA
jgi:DNA end-binding protein Ku